MTDGRLAHYEISAHLGSGGMGDVYEATDTKLGRRVALKFLPDAFVHDTERVARFEREAKTLAALNHPHIATLHDLEEVGGRRFLVMGSSCPAKRWPSGSADRLCRSRTRWP